MDPDGSSSPWACRARSLLRSPPPRSARAGAVSPLLKAVLLFLSVSRPSLETAVIAFPDFALIRVTVPASFAVVLGAPGAVSVPVGTVVPPLLPTGTAQSITVGVGPPRTPFVAPLTSVVPTVLCVIITVLRLPHNDRGVSHRRAPPMDRRRHKVNAGAVRESAVVAPSAGLSVVTTRQGSHNGGPPLTVVAVRPWAQRVAGGRTREGEASGVAPRSRQRQATGNCGHGGEGSSD